MASITQSFLAGGSPMFAILLFGVLTLVVAIGFGRAPDPRKLAVVRALSVATVFAVLAGVAADLAMVFSKVPSIPGIEKSPDFPLYLLMGISEALTPAILGFSLLVVVALVCAVGLRRSTQAI